MDPVVRDAMAAGIVIERTLAAWENARLPKWMPKALTTVILAGLIADGWTLTPRKDTP